MSEREAALRFRLQIPPDDGVRGPECRELTRPDWPQITVMSQDGRITRISLYGEGPLRTDRGLGVGSSEAQVRRAYGRKLEVKTHSYDDEPAHYLTFWTVAGKRGVRYETDQKGVVNTIHVGDGSIELIEGCS